MLTEKRWSQTACCSGYQWRNFEDNGFVKLAKREPWVVVDPDFNREWLVPQLLQFYLVKDGNTGLWSVCDRYTDLMVPNTESKTREQAIRRFYKSVNRPIPTGEKLSKLNVRIAHQGETG